MKKFGGGRGQVGNFRWNEFVYNERVRSFVVERINSRDFLLLLKNLISWKDLILSNVKSKLSVNI